MGCCRQCLLEALISWDTVVVVGRGMEVGERVARRLGVGRGGVYICM